MLINHEQTGEYHRSKAGAALGSYKDGGQIEADPLGGLVFNPASAVGSAALGVSYNVPLRTQVVHGMQRTHGNRAVQRAVQRALRTSWPSGRVSVQRDWYDDQQADEEATRSKLLSITGDEPNTSPNDAFSSDKPLGPAPTSKQATMHDPAPTPIDGPMYGPVPPPAPASMQDSKN